ncbi:MAG: glycosyltransferase [Acidiphilium sp.]|jgi:hypothetical protein|nr:glycosyltransferase [Acidiphilium sp.]
MTSPFRIALPARDEADHLGALLDHLAVQTVPGRISLSLCLNNTTDRSAAVIAAHPATISGRLAIDLLEQEFPPDRAHAGSARRHAMEHAAEYLGDDPDALIITTDADTTPPPGWIAAILAQAVAGADIIGGRLDLADEASLPPPVMRLHLLWAQYWRAVRAIEDEIDPLPWDRPPRHGDHTGASLAIRCCLYRAIGGVPALPLGEDRALVEAACAAGGRLTHSDKVWTRVSPRRTGRAVGGMAASMTTLFEHAEAGVEPLVPGLDHWRRRAAWRRELRAKAGDAAIPLAERNLPPMPDDTKLGIAATAS